MMESFNFCRRTFEEAFFAEENARLLRQMIEADRLHDRRAALAAASGIADAALLDRLVALDIGPDGLTALSLAPLVLVAWADGDLDWHEKAAVLQAAAERHIAAGSPGHALLDGWLRQPPLPVLFEAWAGYAAALLKGMPLRERAVLRAWLLDHARGVAEAAGGFLGLGWTVSPAEAAMLARLAAALPD